MKLAHVLLALSFPLAAAHAQSAPDAHSIREALSDPSYDARVLHDAGERLFASGSNFSALLDESGVTFQPAAGPPSEGVPTLHLAVVGVGRGDSFEPVEHAAPSVDGWTARYLRGSALEERYDVRATGLAQSFVFATRPEGAGDLSVRLAIETELVAGTYDDPERPVVFRHAGEIVATFGRVLGIDAAGRTVAGSVELRGDELVLSLPAAFVDSATYPLVLDPLIGSPTPLGSFVACGLQGDLAYDVTTNTYLFVCVSAVGLQPIITAHRLSGANLTPLGSPITVGVPGAAFDLVSQPQVANVGTVDRFVVAWMYHSFGGPFGGSSSGPRAVAVDAATGVVSPPITGIGAVGNEESLALGGSVEGAPAQAWVVVHTVGDGIEANRLDVPASGAPTVVSSLDLSSTDAAEPAISSSGGINGQHLIVWDDGDATERDVSARLVSSSGAILASATLTNTPGRDERLCAVDGDGEKFLVTWLASNPGSAVTAVEALAVEYTGSIILAQPKPQFTVGASNAFSRVREPEIAWVGNRYLVAYTLELILDGSVQLYLRGVDANGCELCGTLQTQPATPVTRDAVALASLWSSGAFADDRAWLLWNEVDSAGGQEFYVQEAEGVTGGSVVDLGGGCGTGGVLLSDDPYLGNADYTLSITGAEPSATLAIVNLNRNPILYQCGPCSSNVNIGILEVANLVGGAGTVPIPIPCDSQLLGFDTHAQAIAVLPTSSAPCAAFPTVSITNRLHLTIGQ